MNNIDKALHCFQNGYNCSQAIFSTYSEQLGLPQDLALKISCPFGAGMGRTAETCGAVTGAYLLIGLKHGKYLPEDTVSKENSYALVNEFNRRFLEHHGSLLCKELLHNDMKNPEELAYIQEHALWDTVCPHFISTSAILVEELLELS